MENIITIGTNNSKESLLKEIDNIKAELDKLDKELQEMHRDNERINQQYLTIINSNSWKILRRLHPIAVFLKFFISKKEVAYFKLKPSNLTDRELVVDITHVYKEDLKTGIQRVVRSILKNIEGISFDEKYVIRTIFLSSDGLYRYCNDKKVVVPKNKDVFLGLDLNTHVVELYAMFSLWKIRGVKINFIVYDILPILHPHWWDFNVSKVHESWLNTVLIYSDNIACISETVANDIRRYKSSKILFQKNDASIKSFHLGADIENSHPSSGISKKFATYQKKIPKQNTFLMVGTIEPRKGYQEVLDAFNLLWSRGKNINLVIVGKKGWMMNIFLTQIKMHKDLNKKLFYFDDASDELLEKLYKESTCLIAASEAEGFGLPLIEAAKHCLPIIARDIPIFREVADKDCVSFFTTNLLANNIVHWLDKFKDNKHPKSNNMKVQTWDQSAQELVRIIKL